MQGCFLGCRDVFQDYTIIPEYSHIRHITNLLQRRLKPFLTSESISDKGCWNTTGHLLLRGNKYTSHSINSSPNHSSTYIPHQYQPQLLNYHISYYFSHDTRDMYDIGHISVSVHLPMLAHPTPSSTSQYHRLDISSITHPSARPLLLPPILLFCYCRYRYFYAGLHSGIGAM